MRAAPYLLALGLVGAVAWLTAALFPILGLASGALLFLLPVVFVAARGDVGPALLAAVGGATAYNFFLLPPRYSLQIHGLDNVVSVLVLALVALVTSRLATRLKAREAEALERAGLSEEQAMLSAMLADYPAAAALDRGIEWLARRFGELRIVDTAALAGISGLSALDQAAAAWSMHNGDVTGHGTEVMPAADWTFIPLAERSRPDMAVAALARPSDGLTRPAAEIAHLAQLARLVGQSRDRIALDAERREREMLAGSDRLRRTLLAALAHDVRTPLTIATGRLALIATRDEDAAEALAAVRRLGRMTDDLLGAARIEEGLLEPRIESVDPVDAIGAALDAMPVPAGLAIERAVAADLPFVRADPVLLHHMLVNLIDNAMRHARARVAIAARAEDETLLLKIDDDGPGIPAAERTRIFERFARLEGGDRTSGSGLGLAIVKGFADAMGMTVSAGESGAGGARLALRLPLAQGAPA